jgi:hypothetical protein
VASQNLQDFYNLIDVYLDAVLYPRLTPFVFQQEGWHFELEGPQEPLSYKGVVFNEMKGAYSSPDNLLAEYSVQSLFPDTPYRFDSGGDPTRIPDLAFERFLRFHRQFYHPSNARIFFYGNDDPDNRLRIIQEYLKDFEALSVDSKPILQPPLDQPGRILRPVAVGEDAKEDPKGWITLNWLLCETVEVIPNMAFHMLEYILLGMPGSPLRKALIDSGLGEDIAGEGLGAELRQMYFSSGLKGIDVTQADKVEALILDTLRKLVQERIDPLTVQAAVNTAEFRLRENNTGNYPRGLLYMLRALTTWLYDSDPLALLAFEEPLNAIKSKIASGRPYFEELIDRFFLQNPHRMTLILEPDPALRQQEEEEEQSRLKAVRSAMSASDIQRVVENTRELHRLQEAPDPPEALASIPQLRLQDLDPTNKTLPIDVSAPEGTRLLYHDIFTNGILYLDVGFDLRFLPPHLLSYVPLFGRALLEMGTQKEDFVSLSQRISAATGGIHPRPFVSATHTEQDCTAWLFLRGKATVDKARDLTAILQDVILTPRLDNRSRFRQMVLEEKARAEQRLIPGGHQVVGRRLRSHFGAAHWASEQMDGISYLLFLRDLAQDVDKRWPDVLDALESFRRLLFNQRALLLNTTVDESAYEGAEAHLIELADALPDATPEAPAWESHSPPLNEGMIIPAQVNYVGKGGNAYDLGYRFHGSALVITRYIRNAWLWDQVRVRGGAYGAFCTLDRFSGVLSFVSYRDPNLLQTLASFDRTAQFLRETHLEQAELTKSIVGSIGDLDTYRLPDAKGYASMVRYLTGDTDGARQQMRDEVLGTTPEDFKAFAEMLDQVKEQGLVKVLGSSGAIDAAAAGHPGWLKVFHVM